MITLHLGVVDVAYSDASGGGTTTTGQVAEILEKNFGVMQTFVDLKKDQIAGVLADSMAEQIQALVKSGVRPDTRATFTFSGDQKIETLFRTFIYADEMQKIAARMGGVVSAAAQAGVSQRRKRPYAKRDPRPAFVDTGLYVSSFRAWTSAT